MTTAILQLTLAAVFVVAGAAKLLDRGTFKKTLTEFGFSHKPAQFLASILPVVEIAIAAAVLLPRAQPWGASSAIVLLSMFCSAVAWSLLKGRRPDCRCFGQLRSTPVGLPTLIRNAALILMATLVLLATPGTYLGSTAGMRLGGGDVVVALVSLTVAINTWLLFHLFRQHGRLLLLVSELETVRKPGMVQTTNDSSALEGLPPGTTAPPFFLPALSGRSVSLDDLLFRGLPVLLVFSDPQCAPCQALLPDISRWRRDLAHSIAVAILSRGSFEDNVEKIDPYGDIDVLLQSDREIMDRYKVRLTPSAVLVGVDGSIESSIAVGRSAIAELVAQAESRVTHFSSESKIGDADGLSATVSGPARI